MASSTPSVTILQHEPPAPPALLGRFLSEAGLRLDVRRLDVSDEVPTDLSGCDALIVLGGGPVALELAQHRIRVNSVHPTGVDTPMLNGMVGLTERIEGDPDVGALFRNSLPVDLVRSDDISNAVLFLASDESRYVTGLTMTVDAGASAR